MARPVATRARALLALWRFASDNYRRPHIILGGFVAIALLLSIFVGQAWVTARAQPPAGNPATSAAVPQSVEAAPVATASLALSTETVDQEGELTFSGNGYGALEPVILKAHDPANGPLREIARASADGRGNWSMVAVKLPEWLTSGAQQVEAVGERSGKVGMVTLYVHAKDLWVNLSSHGVKQADDLGFVAGGFTPGEQVRVFLAQGQDLQPDSSATPILVVPTDRAGNTAWTQVKVPLVKPETYSLMFQGEHDNKALTQNIVINALVPLVDLSPWWGPPGSHIDLNGTGFLPNEEVALFVGGSDKPVLTITADESGGFWGAGPAMAPNDASGQLRLTFIGQTSHALVTRQYGVTAPKPWAELSSYSGFAGTSVFFSGGGFNAGEQITVHVDKAASPTITLGHANEQGYYRLIGPVNVPPSAVGEVTYVLVGEISHTQTTTTFKVLTPWIPGPPSTER